MGQRSRSAVLDAAFAAFPSLMPGSASSDESPVSSDEFAKFLTSGRFGRFADGLEQVGNCSHPVRVRGSSMRVDAATGEVVSQYRSADEPDGITYLRCGNRRADVCPSCSRVYAADTFQFIRAGACGGKTVPARVADNPLVFATLTAPSFGRVHTARTGSGACHPATRGADLCVHGKPRKCTARHAVDDDRLGQPLCAECYDHSSHVIWQWWAPDLWRRFTIALRRSIAKDLGVAATRLGRIATVQYAKVAEDQRRAAVHFHALIRLDGPATEDGFAPAPAGFDAARLALHVEHAARSVRLTVPGVDSRDRDRVLAFGRQIDTRPVNARRRPDDPAASLSPEQVAGYLAKYATKSASADSPAPNDHQRRLRAECRALVRRDARSGIEDSPYQLLRKWTHTAGFRGHFSSKSRRFSITLGALRRARRRAQALIAEHARTGQPLDLAAREVELLADEADEETRVVGHWRFVGTGWNDETETALALAAAARAREYDQWRAEQRKSNLSKKGIGDE
jgi:hypothetical protein